MPLVVRVGDANQQGGLAQTGAGSVLTNNRVTATHPSIITPHPCCGDSGCSAHCSAVTVTGSSTVFAEGKPVVYVTVGDTCGHSRVQGSPDVEVGT